MIVTFCGHSEIHNQNTVRQWLKETVESLVLQGADMFLIGGYGAYDRMASSVVWKLREQYPQIQSVLVRPYLNHEIDERECDWTLYPRLESVPPKYAISHCNQYMIEKADTVVAYVRHSWGGAAQTLEYAQQKKKSIIQFAEIP